MVFYSLFAIGHNQQFLEQAIVELNMPEADVFMEELNKANHTKQEEIAIHRLRMLMKNTI